VRGGIVGAVGVLLAGLSVAAPASAELAPASPLGYTGGQQTYIVPAGVTLQPLIQLTSPVSGASYRKGQVVDVGYDCYTANHPPSDCHGSELGPGASSSTSVESGAPIDTSTPGKYTFKVFNDWASGPSRVATTVTYTVSGGLTKGSSSISGATGKHPKLTVKVTTPQGESITKLSIQPPAGISFVKSRLKHGVQVSGAKSEALSHGALVVTLKHAAGSVTVRVSGGAIVASKKLAKQVKHGKVKHVIFTVDASLTNGSIAQLSLTTRL